MARPLWLRSALSRPLSVLSLVLLSALVAAVAVLGPLLVRALHQSALVTAVARASDNQRTVTVFAQVTASSDIDAARQAVQQPFGFDGALSTRIWTPLRITATSFSSVIWTADGTSLRSASRATAAENGCAGITIVGGRCPSAPGETLVATDDARQHKITDGAEIDFRLAKASLRHLKVVGRYDPDRSLPAVLARPNTADAVLSGITGEPLIVTGDQLGAMALPLTVTADVSLRPGLLLADEPSVRTTLAQVEASARVGVAGQQLFFSSLVGPVLDLVDRDADDASLLLELVEAQAVAVAFFALMIVVGRVGSARTGEWTLGRLRGLPRWRWLRSIYTEPALALLLGVPIGAGLGVLIARFGVDRALGPQTTLEIWRSPVLVAVGAAAAAALIALVVSSLPGLRRPPIEVIQQSAESRRLAVGALILQVVALLLAGVSLYQLLTQDDLTEGRSRLGLLAPALLALAFGVLAVRLLVVGVRALTRRPPRLRTGLIASRRAARMPSSLNPAMVVAAGLALAVFSGQVLVLSERNVGLRVDAVVGAPVVLKVDRPATVDLLSAVDRADPTGRYAMAVQEKAASSDGGTSRIVAVDATRFDALSSWRPEWAGIGPLGDRLRPGLSAPIMLVGHTVTVDLSDVTSAAQQLTATGASGPSVKASAPDLSLTVETDHGWRTAPLGPLDQGSHRYTADLKFQLVDNGPFVDACLSGCRLVNFLVYPDPNLAFTFGYTVRSIRTDTQTGAATQAWLQQPGWHERTEFRPGTAGTGSVRVSGDGLTVDTSTGGTGDQSVVVPGDTSENLPVVLGRNTAPQPAQDGSDALTGTGLDGQQQLIKVLAHGTLPRALNDGVLADLRNIGGLSDPGENEATSEVWLAADAPEQVRTALEQNGLRITGTEQITGTSERLLAQPITRGAALGVLIGLVAAALSLLTLAVARAAEATRNRAVWRALLEAGHPPRLIRAVVITELAVPAVVAVLVGAGAGALAVAFASSRIPLLTNDPPGPPFALGLAWGPIGLVVAVSVGVIVIIALLAALIETRSAGRRS